MLKFSEIFEFSKGEFRKISILKEFEWFEWFEWFGPSPIEPFNSAIYCGRATARGVLEVRVIDRVAVRERADGNVRARVRDRVDGPVHAEAEDRHLS